VTKAGDKQQRSQEGKGGKHQGLKPANAEEAGKFLNNDVSKGEKEGGEESPESCGSVEFSRPPRFRHRSGGDGKKGHG
jgi:hypothetical protein